MTVIYTHINPDLDALASVWTIKTFAKGYERAEVKFRSNDWDGAGMEEGDMAVDMDAGGKGIKGDSAEGLTHSCFATLVSKYVPKNDMGAIFNLVAFIDAQDTYGSAVKHFLPGLASEIQNILSFSGINAVFRAIQSMNHRKDYKVMNSMLEIFSGMLKAGRARQRAVVDAENAEISSCGNVAIISPKEYGTNAVLFDEKGVRVIIYVDGFNLGIIRKDTETLSMSDHRIVEFVNSYDNIEEWFAHPSGFLFCRGSRKSPANSLSKVYPQKLMELICKILK